MNPLREKFNAVLNHAQTAESPVAQYSVGRLYESGFGIPRDQTQAQAWYDKALSQLSQIQSQAERGDPEAQFVLGQISIKGQGTLRSEAVALKWYQAAAAKGNLDGQYSLGLMCKYGIGMTPSDADVMKWLRTAAEKGHPAAQNGLGIMYQSGSGVAKSDAEALNWYRKGADQGYAPAQSNLGQMNEYGLGVRKNEAEAVKWYQASALQGDRKGQFHLGWMYRNGTGVQKNEAEAIKWFQAAATQGCVQAQYVLGLAYKHGSGVVKNPDEAVKWFRAAAEQGHGGGQTFLGQMYQIGLGVAKSEVEAVKWYRRAISKGHKQAISLLNTIKVTPDLEDQVRIIEQTEALETQRKTLEAERQRHAEEVKYRLAAAEEAKRQRLAREEADRLQLAQMGERQRIEQEEGALSHYREEQYQEALLLCDRGLSYHQQSPIFLRLKAMSFYRQKRYDLAQEAFKAWGVVNSASTTTIWVALCRWKGSEEDTRRIAASLEEVNRAIEKTPEEPIGYVVRGCLTLAAGKLTKAEGDFYLFEEKLAAKEMDPDERLILTDLHQTGELALANKKKGGQTPLVDQQSPIRIIDRPTAGPVSLVERQVKVEARVELSYAADEPDQLTVNEGEWVEVINEYENGWWLCRRGKETGLVPGDYLAKGRRIDSLSKPAPKRPISQSGTSSSSSHSSGEDARMTGREREAHSPSLFSQHWEVKASDVEKKTLVGEGGCGKVYKGKWKGVTVAMKELQGRLGNRELEELNREGSLMSSLHHPHVIHLFGVTRSAPYCLVMEWMGKGSFYDVLRKEELSFQQKTKIVLGAAKGLSFLHDKNIVHRDMKSLNILLTNESKAKIGDFGLSVVKQSLRSQSRTADGKIGTLKWKAPELLSLGGKHTKASDIYALGIVMWEALTGQEPYEEADDDVQIMLHVKGGGRPEIPEGAPLWYRELIERCWAQNPVNRPTAAEVVEGLKRGQKEKVPEIRTGVGLKSGGYISLGAGNRDF